MKSGKGFQFFELSVATIIVLVISVNVMLPMRQHRDSSTNEATPVDPLLPFNKTTITNQDLRHGTNITCKLTGLGANGSHNAAPHTQLEGKIDSTLASGTKSGYIFSDVICRSESTGLVISHGWGASPATPGETGQRYFCSDQTGVIKYDTDSVANCMVNGKSL